MNALTIDICKGRPTVLVNNIMSGGYAKGKMHIMCTCIRSDYEIDEN